MLFSKKDDFNRCSEIVKKKLQRKNIDVNDAELKKITENRTKKHLLTFIKHI